MYANYGEPQDLKTLEKNKVNLNGTVVLMRAGKISMAQKVVLFSLLCLLSRTHLIACY